MLSKNSSALIVLKEARKRGILCPFNLFSSPIQEVRLDVVVQNLRLASSEPFTSKRQARSRLDYFKLDMAQRTK